MTETDLTMHLFAYKGIKLHTFRVFFLVGYFILDNLSIGSSGWCPFHLQAGECHIPELQVCWTARYCKYIETLTFSNFKFT